ncbi:hypothetical protein B0H63DRAFT_462756 [Podospora didyma]|uniref:Uncharacterized protein n=1 Tax=Podospora didyma TaxID=330526 RepID=A0AAE0P8C4_9PEZI|nr:hypothetical protein B0H63DRAFT_462756 [Podospora didyma]
MPPRRGLYVVRSRIISEAILPPATFHQWYEEIHIPDVLNMTIINSSFRYAISDDDKNKSPIPYLAIYPLADLAWFYQPGCPFFKVPLHSDLLPNESKFIFDVAAFDMSFYERLVSVGEDTGGPAKALVLVFYDEDVAEGKEAEFLLRKSLNNESLKPLRSTLFRLDTAPNPNREDSNAPGVENKPKLLAIVSAIQ